MKTSNQKPFDAQVRDKFENFEVEVPQHLWDNIAQALDEEEQSNKIVRLAPRKTPYRMWWAAASLLLCAGLGWWMIQDQKPTVYLHAQNEQVMPATEENQVVPVAPIIEEEKTIVSTPVYAQADPAKVLVTPTDEGNENQTQDWQRPQRIESVGQFASLHGKHQRIPYAEVSLTNQNLSNKQLTWGAPIDTRTLRVSDMLNFMVAQVDKREEKWIVFSDNEEGSLLIDFNLGLARTQ